MGLCDKKRRTDGGKRLSVMLTEAVIVKCALKPGELPS